MNKQIMPAMPHEAVVNYYRAAAKLRTLPADQYPAREYFQPIEDEFDKAKTMYATDEAIEQQICFVYMIKLMVCGAYDFAQCLHVLEKPMSMYDYNGLMCKLLYEYSYATSAELWNILDKMMAFLAHVTRFPIIPDIMLDCKSCVLCLFETDHSLAATSKRFDGKTCCHIFEAHPKFTHVKEFTVEEYLDVDDNKRSDIATIKDFTPNQTYMDAMLCGNGEDAQTAAMDRENASVTAMHDDYTNFTTAMSDLKRANDLNKLKIVMKNAVVKLNHVMIDYSAFTSPKNLSYFAIVFVRAFQLGLRLRVAREQRILSLMRIAAQPAAVLKLKNKLAGTVDKNARQKMMELFYSLATPFNYKYFKGSNIQAHRILWFKHMESLGYSCLKLIEFINYLVTVPVESMAGIDRTSVVDPIGIDKRVITLYWLSINIYTFCTLWNDVMKVRHGDDPKLSANENGVYVFNGTVGYIHFVNGQLHGGIREWPDLLTVLSEYDVLFASV